MDTTVVKGLSVLEALVQAETPLSLAQLTDRLPMQKSNVHRLLQTLSHIGYVEQEPETGRYRATLKLWELGTRVVAGHPVKRIAGPYMQELHRKTSETVSLTVLDGIEVLYLDKIISPRPLHFTTQPGSRAPALLTSSGIAMLAHERDARALVVESIATEPRLAKFEVEATMATLEKSLNQGFAMLDGRARQGLTGIAAPIMGRNGRAAGALTISGPTERMDKKARTAAIEAVLTACARIAETAGAV